MNKRAQTQIIATVLIILIVLAAIVVVWQVVNTFVRAGSGEIEKQGNCLGVSLKVENKNPGSDSGANTIFLVTRTGGGEIIPEPNVNLVVDGDIVSCASWSPINPDWTLNYNRATCTLSSAATESVKAFLNLSDGTICSTFGEVSIN